MNDRFALLPLPPPLGEVGHRRWLGEGTHLLPSQSRLAPCQLSQWESQGGFAANKGNERFPQYGVERVWAEQFFCALCNELSAAARRQTIIYFPKRIVFPGNF